MKTIKSIFLSLLYFSLAGCYQITKNPDSYFNYWCEPSNASGYYSDGSNIFRENNYYDFHYDEKYKSKVECIENQYYGTSGESSRMRKQLDDNLDEQVEEKRKRDEEK